MSVTAVATPTLSGGFAGLSVYLLRSLYERPEVRAPIHIPEPIQSVCAVEEEIVGLPQSQFKILLLGVLIGVLLGPLIDRIYHIRRQLEFSTQTWNIRSSQGTHRPVWLSASP